mmetsp:Transcript_58810/g.167230  ORF Transcript_58810/g.167230 Transcript_58810/m.167230 type:complete len:316 (+) Transcript_58810:134-1081(+)
MNVAVVKGIAIVAYLAVALVGGFGARWVAAVSPKWMQFCNACAGGVLVSVGLVHMLSENAEKLDGWGKSLASFLGGAPEEVPCTGGGKGCEETPPFPLGNVLAGLGFFLILVAEQLGGHEHGGHDHESHVRREVVVENEDGETDIVVSDDSNFSEAGEAGETRQVRIAKVPPLAGLGTLVGISVHTLIEGIVTGAMSDGGELLLLMAAVLLHKGMAGFAVGSSLLSASSKVLWLIGVLIFAFMSPLGILIGMIVSGSVDGACTGAIQCFAAGTLLAIGISDMLLPSLHDSKTWRKRKLMGAITCFTGMSVLAAWA